MIQKIANATFFVLMIVLNYLANALPLNGVTTGELSDAYPNLFVPAGLTFSIWGVIYLLLFVLVVFQFSNKYKDFVELIGWGFAFTCIFNGLWILAWHYQWLIVSFVIMLALLATLTFINIRLKSLSFNLLKAGFGVYLGWICIATIANLTALLVQYSWSGWGLSEQFWTIGMIAIGALVVMVAQARLANPFIGVAVTWAFLGIAIRRQADFKAIYYAAIMAMVIVALYTIYQFVRKRVQTN